MYNLAVLKFLNSWEHYKVAVNAFYSRRDKMILLLPGLLRKPYFHSDAPMYVDFLVFCFDSYD